MSQLQNIINTMYFQLETLKTDHAKLNVAYGFPKDSPTGVLIALEHDKTKADEMHELAGCRKRPRVLLVDIYTATQAERNDLCEAVKDLFENKAIPVLDSSLHDTGVLLYVEGVRVEVDLAQYYKARAKIYIYTLL